MKSFLFAALATASLLASPSAFAAAPLDSHDRDGRYEQQRPGDRDFNYGYDRNHRVSREEIARYQAQHRNDNRGRDNDHFDRNQNYGFDRDHRVSPSERRDWERGHNYGYAQNHRVTPQERARWEAQYRR
ncbi:hypothetical protein [Hymenobacter cheonanensis]|uniref:hypothetical protein n=1 Tax=Hymenobacter sp. CA2-7 TaxID=3063993 RepID=UPI00271414F3|nr:hypothetical protein [Hymenobacter sp. CA2-7]MDO7886727.1 hypothetical protein [Hymenobacter sp. CA2-7]